MPRLRGLILSTLLTVGCVGGMLGIDAAKGQEIAPSFVPAASSDLQDYVQRADDSFRWEVRETLSVAGCDVRRLHLTSQTWHGIPWKHVMYLIKPRELDPKRTDAVMLIAGGRWHSVWPENGPDEVSLRSEAQLMAGVANQFGCVIAVLTQVPFQPMMGDRYEDEIIAATFAKYLQTQESDWPLLLPMVKSAVRGMDASQAAAKQEWGVDLESFTVTGASKRGWTTWLTAAVDSRVSGLAPMVIDMLNMQEQMQHQLNCWGKYSEQIADYTELQLPKYLDTPPGRALQCIVDPFAYRDRIEQPKLLIFGTNDRYWPIDACQNYWDELQGDKYLLYVPNQGHGIEDIPRVVGSLNALHQSLRGGEPLPKLSWDFETRENDVVLDVEASGSVDTVRGWVARSSNRDFRDSTWTQTAMQVGRDGTWSLQVPLPDSGAIACYAEVVTEGDQLPGFFSTNVRVFEAE